MTSFHSLAVLLAVLSLVLLTNHGSYAVGVNSTTVASKHLPITPSSTLSKKSTAKSPAITIDSTLAKSSTVLPSTPAKSPVSSPSTETKTTPSSLRSSIITPSTPATSPISLTSTHTKTNPSSSRSSTILPLTPAKSSTSSTSTKTKITPPSPHTSRLPPLLTSVTASRTISSAKPFASKLTPHPDVVVKYECGAKCKSLKKRLWAAGFFAVFFAVVTIALLILRSKRCGPRRDHDAPYTSF